MPKVNLSGMNVEALMDLRRRIGETLLARRAEIEKQLQRMGAVAGGARVVRGRRSTLKGRKSRRSIEAVQVRLGQVVAQDLFGLSMRSRVEGNSMIS
jgi:hypothetical protein